MECGDIIFVSGGDIISRLVRLFDGHGKFSHCCIALNDKVILEAQYYTVSRVVPFYFKNYEVVSLGLSKEQKQKVLELGIELTGRKYDFKLIWFDFLREVWNKKLKISNSPKSMICSELVEILLQEVGAIPNDEKIRGLTPNELFRYLKTIK